MTSFTRRTFGKGAVAGAIAMAGYRAARPFPATALLDHGESTAIGSGQDPMVTADPASGAIYLAWIALDAAEDGATETGAAASTEAEEVSALPAGRVLLARSSDGGATFGAPVVASGADTDVISYIGSSPIVRLGPGGEVYVVYQRNLPHEGVSFGRDLLRVARSTDGGATFAPASDVFAAMDGVEAGTFHDALVAPDGALYIAWLSYRQYMPENGVAESDAKTEVRVTRSDDGGATFGSPVLVDDVSCECCRPAFALGGDGTLYLAWRDQEPQDDGGDPVRNVVIARSADRGGTWSAPAPINDDGWRVGGCPESGPEIAADSAGRLRAAWFTGKEDGPGVYYAVSEDGGASFSDPVALATDDYFPHANVRMDLDAADNVWVTWDDKRTEAGAIQLARIAADGTVTPVFAEALAGVTSDVAIGPVDAAVTWLDDGEVKVMTVPAGETG